MRKSTEEYLVERCRMLEEQVKHQEARILMLTMQRDENIAVCEKAQDTLKSLLKLLQPSIYEANDNGEKLRFISMSVWERYSKDNFNLVEAILKEHNMIEVEGWEEASV